MALQLPVPLEAYADVIVPINGTKYTLLYEYNSRNTSLYVTVLQDEEIIVGRIRLVTGSNLFNYRALDILGGLGIIFQFNATDKPPMLGNVGIDQDYSFLYVSNQEYDEALAESE